MRAKTVRQEEVENKFRADEILATEIRKIAYAVQSMNNGPLKRATIITLLQYETKLGRGCVETIYSAIERLDEICLKPKKKS